MLQKTFLSIIIPVYNAESYLKSCVYSILNQDYQNYEIILINDGSKDRSGFICDELKKEDSRIKVFHKTNSGVSSTRNIGIENANGEWITFVDSDDELVPNALNLLINQTDNNYDLIDFAYCIIQNDSVITPIRKKKEVIVNKKTFYRQLFNYPWYDFHGYSVAKLYKKDILNKFHIRFAEDIYYKEDGLFVCQYVAHCRSIFESTETIYKYIQRDTSAVATYSKQFNNKSLSHLIASIQIYETIKKQNLGEEIEKEAKCRICYSFDLLKESYKSSEIKDGELYFKMNELFRKNVSTAFYYKYRITKGYWFLKRQIYLLLKFLKIKK